MSISDGKRLWIMDVLKVVFRKSIKGLRNFMMSTYQKLI